jgi:site-specific recombinase XerD
MCGSREFDVFASWYMMNGGDLYELAKILGHANIKMTERYAKLGNITLFVPATRPWRCGT